MNWRTEMAEDGVNIPPNSRESKAGSPDEQGEDMELLQEIEEVMKETAKLWRGGSKGRLRAVWDTEDPEPWYIPEEIREPLTTWPELDHYWSPTRGGGLADFQWGFANLRVKRLAPDIALAMFDHIYELTLAVGGERSFGGFDRALAIFRKKPEGWRQILYAQCPLGPETYVRAIREMIVEPDFDTFCKRVANKGSNAGKS